MGAVRPAVPRAGSRLRRHRDVGCAPLGGDSHRGDRVGSDDVERRLEAAFAADDATVWVERLRAAGIGAAVARTQEETMEDPLAKPRGLSLTRPLRSGEPIRTVGPNARLSRTPIVPGEIAGPPGEDLDEVLARLGMTDRRDHLVDIGPCSQGGRPVQTSSVDFKP
ncbi:CoA transferase [Microbacterium sp.]|uniref:CoA transferase n=1 Tax=Microbacterium sp. TaxID=51671 RepID=UPI003A84691E